MKVFQNTDVKAYRTWGPRLFIIIRCLKLNFIVVVASFSSPTSSSRHICSVFSFVFVFVYNTLLHTTDSIIH